MQSRCLLLEGIHSVVEESLRKYGWHVVSIDTALGEEELLKQLDDVDFLGVKDLTVVSAKVIRARKLTLNAIACFGLNHQVDLQEATESGIPVFQRASANSVCELVVSQMIALSRQVIAKHLDLRGGTWTKPATFSEMRGKCIALFENSESKSTGIHSVLEKYTTLMGCSLVYHRSPLFLEEEETLEEEKHDESLSLSMMTMTLAKDIKDTLRKADVLIFNRCTPPVPAIDTVFLGFTKPGCIILNVGHGSTLVLLDVLKHLQSGHIGGLFLDSLPVEPQCNGIWIPPLAVQWLMQPPATVKRSTLIASATSACCVTADSVYIELGTPPTTDVADLDVIRLLVKQKNVVVTPGLGFFASSISHSEELALSMINYLYEGSTLHAINFPSLQLVQPQPQPPLAASEAAVAVAPPNYNRVLCYLDVSITSQKQEIDAFTKCFHGWHILQQQMKEGEGISNSSSHCRGRCFSYWITDIEHNESGDVSELVAKINECPSIQWTRAIRCSV